MRRHPRPSASAWQVPERRSIVTTLPSAGAQLPATRQVWPTFKQTCVQAMLLRDPCPVSSRVHCQQRMHSLTSSMQPARYIHCTTGVLFSCCPQAAEYARLGAASQSDGTTSSAADPAEPGLIPSNTQDARSDGRMTAAADGSGDHTAEPEASEAADSAAACWPGFNAAQQLEASAAARKAGHTTADVEAAEEAAQEAVVAAARSEASQHTGSSLKDAASSAVAAAGNKAADTADRACAGAVIAAEHMLKSGQSAAAAAADETAQVKSMCVVIESVSSTYSCSVCGT